MPRVSSLFFKTAILFLIAGIAIGLKMSISGVHNVTGAHAHCNLLGWVTMALMGTYYTLAPSKAEGRLPVIQYGVYTLGVLIMIPSLYMLLLGNPQYGLTPSHHSWAGYATRPHVPSASRNALNASP